MYNNWHGYLNESFKVINIKIHCSVDYVDKKTFQKDHGYPVQYAQGTVAKLLIDMA